MFGRVRAAPSSSSSSSLDCLELERPSSKIIKDDSLSIYEITLNKLRLGSKRALNSSPGETNSPSSPEAMKIDAPSTSSTSASSSSGHQSNNICKQQMEDNSCNTPAVIKCKRWPWIHNHKVLTVNPESQMLGP